VSGAGPLLDWYRAALAAVHGGAAVGAALAGETPPQRPVHVLALGKAAEAMLRGAAGAWPQAIARALVVAPAGSPQESPPLPFPVRRQPGNHPVPGAESLAAGAAVADFLQRVPAGETLLVLLSGGASSLAELPRDGVDLPLLRELNTRLLAAGLDIRVMNALRGRFSRLKAGGAADLCVGVEARVLFISDVPGDAPAAVGSGPFWPPEDVAVGSGPFRTPGDWAVSSGPLWPPADAGLGSDLFGSRGAAVGSGPFGPLEDRTVGSNPLWPPEHAGATAVPEIGWPELEGLLRRLPPAPRSASRPAHRLVGSNGDARAAVAAAASAAGLQAWDHGLFPETSGLPLACRLVRFLRDAPAGVHVWGGEAPVRLPDRPGRGGRAQHLAGLLLLLWLARGWPRPMAALSAATDGVDGNSGAAGAWFRDGRPGTDRGTRAALRQALRRADTATFWQGLEQVVPSAETGTNVMDLLIVHVGVNERVFHGRGALAP
jgi:glycerate 2-kinase